MTETAPEGKVQAGDAVCSVSPPPGNSPPPAPLHTPRFLPAESPEQERETHVDPAQRHQAVLVLDHEELLFILRVAIIRAAVLLGHDDVGDGELVPHLQGSTGRLLPTGAGRWVTAPSRSHCCPSLVRREFPKLKGTAALGTTPRKHLPSIDRSQELYLQVIDKGVAGFSESECDPQFSLSFCLSPHKSPGKSWMPEEGNLAPCLEMTPQNSVIAKRLEAAGLQQVATSTNSISEQTSTSKAAPRGAGEPGWSCQSKPAHTSSLGKKELPPVSVGIVLSGCQFTAGTPQSCWQQKDTSLELPVTTVWVPSRVFDRVEEAKRPRGQWLVPRLV